MLVDINLSKPDRAYLLAGLRAASRGPILMLINANTVDEIVEANQEGADECLVKPVNPAVLVVKAMAWLGHGQRGGASATFSRCDSLGFIPSFFSFSFQLRLNQNARAYAGILILSITDSRRC